MSSTQKEFDLINWDTPFSGVRFPSIFILGDERDKASNLTIAVAPKGVDKYPKYLIRFSNVLAYKTEEEAQFTEESQEDLIFESKSNCSYLRPNDSYWWKAYGEYMRNFHDAEPMHFYLFGGDNNVQVFAENNPTIEKVEKQRIVNLKYVV